MLAEYCFGSLVSSAKDFSFDAKFSRSCGWVRLAAWFLVTCSFLAAADFLRCLFFFCASWTRPHILPPDHASRPGFCGKFSLPGNQFACRSVLVQPACSAPPVFPRLRRSKRPSPAPGIFWFPPLFWSHTTGSIFSLAFQAPGSVSHLHELRIPRSCTNSMPLFNLVCVVIWIIVWGSWYCS
jgi:hypothetical protein